MITNQGLDRMIKKLLMYWAGAGSDSACTHPPPLLTWTTRYSDVWLTLKTRQKTNNKKINLQPHYRRETSKISKSPVSTIAYHYTTDDYVKPPIATTASVP